jgi:hypothetical protein
MRLDPGQIEVVDDEMAVVLRSKTGVERLKIASPMFESVRKMIINMLRAEHPDWDEPAIPQGTRRAALLARKNGWFGEIGRFAVGFPGLRRRIGPGRSGRAMGSTRLEVLRWRLRLRRHEDSPARDAGVKLRGDLAGDMEHADGSA